MKCHVQKKVQRKNNFVIFYLVYHTNEGYFNTLNIMKTFMREAMKINNECGY